MQANPDAAAIGKLTRDGLAKLGRWEALKEHTFVFKRIYRCGRCKAWHITSTPPLRIPRRVKH